MGVIEVIKYIEAMEEIASIYNISGCKKSNKK
jgi:hypothetical protein